MGSLSDRSSGRHFEAWSSSLSRYGSSWLARLTHDSPNYNPSTNEYDFPRSGKIFESILTYLATGALSVLHTFFTIHLPPIHRAGELHRPQHVCKQEFLEEIMYFGVSPSAVSQCCRIQGTDKGKKRSQRSHRIRHRWHHCARAVIRSLRRQKLDSAKCVSLWCDVA